LRKRFCKIKKAILTTMFDVLLARIKLFSFSDIKPKHKLHKSIKFQDLKTWISINTKIKKLFIEKSTN